MAAKLLKKELKLCLHPAALIMLGLSAMVLIPNYPYTVIFFYTALGLFFINQGARENRDVTFTLTLPVAKKDAVTGRFLLSILQQGAAVLLTTVMTPVRAAVLSAPNAAGMDANLALAGEGLLMFGVFNLVFYPDHYRDVSRVGVPFFKASVVLFLIVTADIVCTYAVPLFRDVLDTPDPQNLGAKLVFDGVCLLCYAGLTFLSLRLSQARFQKQDIR